MASNIGDRFNKLKQNIVGTKTSDIDSKLDSTIKDITLYRSKSGSNGYIDLVKNIISKQGLNQLGNNNSLFGNEQSSPESFGQGRRLMRYRIYNSIVENISYCKRALDVLTGNILSPDDITKMSLEVKSKSYLEDEVKDKSRVNRVKDLINRMKIEDYLHNIISNTLLYGDYFCEIADSKTALTSKSMISENKFFSGLSDSQKNSREVVYSQNDIEVTLNYSSFNETDNQKNNDDDKKEKINLSNLNLVFHEPNRIVKLQSELFPLCFGYLVFPKHNFINQNINPQEQQINDICINILKNLQTKIPQASEFKDDDELKQIISSMIKETGGSQVMNIRYVPPDKMSHFMIPSTKYYPYGESIFDACKFDAKILMSLKTALAIQRLANSTEKRKIGVEIGLPKDAANQVQNLKEEFRKRKISLDNMGTIDTIPSMISTYENIYIPQKDGKPYVDIDSFDQGNVDTSRKTEELEYIRSSIVASLGVPNAFLNLESELCLFSGTYIPMLDGGSLTLDKIIEEYKNGNHDMWTYSYDHDTGKIAPGKIVWADYTRLQTQLVRVHLDNGKYVDCTPDHPFMLRDGTYKEAQYLKEDESLMPLYRKNTINKSTRSDEYKTGVSYELVYHPDKFKKRWELTYHMVDTYFNGKKQRGYVVHHKNYNPRNNHPNNLQRMTNLEHVTLHGKDLVRWSPDYKGIVYEDRECKICKNSFKIPYNSPKLSCSDECRKELRKLSGLKSWELRKDRDNYNHYDIYCFICGKEITSRFQNLKESSYKKLTEKVLACDDEFCKKHIRSIVNLTKKGTKLSCEIGYDNCSVCGELYIRCDEKTESKKLKIPEVCGVRCVNVLMNKKACESKIKKSHVKTICPICDKEFTVPQWYLKEAKNPCCGDEFCKSKNRNYRIREQYIQEKNNYKIEDKEEKVGLNHKVITVEWLEGNYDTADITVEGFHNFAVDAGVIVHNSAKAVLSEENILFARTIIGHQKYLKPQINDLIEKIMLLNNPEESLLIRESVDISLPSPRSLQYERESRYLGEIVTLIENLERIGVPKEYTTKKYLSQFDWSDVENWETNQNIEKNIGSDNEEEDEQDMGF